jgi:hypothetical protein
MGVQKFKQRVMAAGIVQGGGELRYAEVVLTSAEVKALRATPKTLVPAPGAGKVLEFLGGLAFLDAGTNVFAEATANLAVKFTNGSGVQVSQTVETTGFIDQAADTVTNILPKLDSIVSKANGENQPLVLHNLGAGEITGNAAGDGVLRVKFAYRIHQTGF